MNTQQIADQLKALVDTCEVSKQERRAGLRAINTFETVMYIDEIDKFLGAPFAFTEHGISRKLGFTDSDFIEALVTALDAYYLRVNPPIHENAYTVYQAAAYLHMAPISLKKSIERHGLPAFKRLGRGRDLIFSRADLDAFNDTRKPAGNPNWVAELAE